MKIPLSSLGYLRLGLLGLAILSMLLPTVEWLVVQSMGELSDQSALSLSARLIAPVMAPIVIVVILLDMIIAKVRAADDPTGEGNLYRMISRVDTILIIVMLFFWIPFFVSLTS